MSKLVTNKKHDVDFFQQQKAPSLKLVKTMLDSKTET